ncbi:NADPH-dependent FMN reductase family protein [Vagococcus acidifermentans]|uniref:hypothetical protein n=1 Tax=Vagococcus acidifermentans TaxID=564710 RepID=UPI001FE71B5F|nr:hypothetical protein [Vagococcus acidifermentans]
MRVRKTYELVPDVDAAIDIPEISSADLEWADAYIFSSPSRFGVMASHMKQFFDLQGGLWGAGKLQASNPRDVHSHAALGSNHCSGKIC